MHVFELVKSGEKGGMKGYQDHDCKMFKLCYSHKFDSIKADKKGFWKELLNIKKSQNNDKNTLSSKVKSLSTEV
jgi:hypothetical protein